MYSYGPPHMDVQKQDDQHEATYSNYMRTQDVTLKTCRRRWMIGRSGERGSGISVLAAWHDDDDIYIYILMNKQDLTLNHRQWLICNKTIQTTHTHIYTRRHAHTHTYTHPPTHTYICIYVYICIYIYIYINQL